MNYRPVRKIQQMKTVASGKYWQIKQGTRYWNVWLGNPFCIGLSKVPRTTPLLDLISDVQQAMEQERIRFSEQFPEQEW